MRPATRVRFSSDGLRTPSQDMLDRWLAEAECPSASGTLAGFADSAAEAFDGQRPGRRYGPQLVDDGLGKPADDWRPQLASS